MLESRIYDYQTLLEDLKRLSLQYPFIKTDIIGKSCLCRNIYVLRLGRGAKKVFYNAAHHGLEWITSALMMRFVFDYALCYVKGIRFRGFDIRRLYEKVSIYIAPMVNPDGVEMSKTIEGWQANARGVDLNHNYDAGWHEYKALAAKNGITRPCATRYPGKRCESEPETAAVAGFTRKMDFDYVVAFHSQGKVIYWQYGDMQPSGSRRIGEFMSRISGYELDEADGLSSYSGYKDWFIKEFSRPGFTIEVGLGKNPLPYSALDGIYGEVAGILVIPEIV